MKKAILLLVAVFAFGYSQAQFKGGIKGGLNFASSDVGFAGVNPSDKTGYHFGLYANIGLAGFAIQPELLYSFKGGDKLDLTYIEIPVLFQKSFAKVLNVHLGPQFGFLTQAEQTLDPLINSDIKSELKSLDLSLAFGLGLDIPGGVSAGARYVLGLSDVNNTFLGTNPEIKNKTFQVYVGYKLFGN